ncbi:helix-turn-helix domain-containing protein [Hymenobacter tenuis]
METHAERFRHLLEVWGLTQEELGNLCGIKRGTVGTIVNGKTTPDADALAELLRRKPDLNPDWLLMGNGPMLRDGRSLTPVEAPAKKEAGRTLEPLGRLKLSKMEGLTDEQVSDVLIENVSLREQLQAALDKIAERDAAIADLKEDKRFFKEELRKKPEGNPDAALFVNPSSTPSMIPTKCKTDAAQPEATVIEMAAWVARKIEEHTGSVTHLQSDATAA